MEKAQFKGHRSGSGVFSLFPEFEFLFLGSYQERGDDPKRRLTNHKNFESVRDERAGRNISVSLIYSSEV